MIVRFAGSRGLVTLAAEPGETLLAVGQRGGLPLEGTCEGQRACATCHVIVDPADWRRVGPPGADEDDLLDLAPNAGPTSRLSCQITLTPAMDGLLVRVPGA